MSAVIRKLPPIGAITEENYGEVLDFINNVRTESIDDRAQWLQPQPTNYLYFQYGTDHIPYGGEIIVPEIQNAIIATANIATQDPPRATLEPVETGEPPLYFWAGPPEIGMMLGLLPEQVGGIGPETDEAGNPTPPLPIDEIKAGELKAMTASIEVAPMLMPGMIRPEWLQEVSDQTAAEFWQKVLDVAWERSNLDLFWRQNIVDNAVQGWAPFLIEFDEQEMCFDYSHVPLVHAYIDPVARTVQKAEYVGVEMPIDASRAVAKYPDLADVVADQATEGQPNPPDGSIQISDRYNRQYKRAMVWLSIWWFRNQEAYMTPEQAVAEGRVTEEQQTVTAITGDGGLPTLAGPSYMTPEGEEVKPGQPGWPTRSALRQITMLGDRLVDDRECEHYNIPVGWNVNIPLPGNSPYGISDIDRIKSLQNAESEVLGAMVEHTKFYKSPIMVISQSMADILGPDRVALGARPGMVHVVPDDQYMASGGNPLSIVNPPPLSEAHAQLFPTLKGLTTEMGGNTDVLQGRTDGDASSGRAIEALQAAGTGQVGFKLLRLKDEITWATKIMVYNLTWRVPAAKLALIHSKPPHVIEAFIQKGRASEWNVKPIVSSGAGGVQAQKRALAQQDLSLMAITMETYRETVGINHQLEEDRMAAAAASLQRTMGGAVSEPDASAEGGGDAGGPPKAKGDNQPKDQVGGTPVPAKDNPMSNN